jgi:hypothetical protein
VVKQRIGKLIAAVFCLIAICLYFVLPIRDSSDSYSIIRSQISQTPNARVLEVAPDLQPRYFPWINQIPAALVSADPAQDDRRFMRAASIGQSELFKYLNEQRVTHLLVAPLNGERNHLFYRWSNTPSVNIRLTEPFFREVARAYGDYPASLFEVVPLETSDFCSSCSGVELQWSGVRETAIDTSRYGYIDGPDIVWILGQDQPSLRLITGVNSGVKYRVVFKIVAAYGESAPPQILKFQTEKGAKFEKIVGGPSREVSVELGVGKELEIHAVLPCMIPAVTQLEVGNQDTRELCFGISSIKVEEIK